MFPNVIHGEINTDQHEFSVSFVSGLVDIHDLRLGPDDTTLGGCLIRRGTVKEARALLTKRNDDQEKRLFESLLQVALGDPEQAAVIRRGSSTRMLKPVLDAEGNVILPSRSQET